MFSLLFETLFPFKQLQSSVEFGTSFRSIICTAISIHLTKRVRNRSHDARPFTLRANLTAARRHESENVTEIYVVDSPSDSQRNNIMLFILLLH